MSSVVLKVWIDLNANAVFAFFNQAPLGKARNYLTARICLLLSPPWDCL